MLNRWAPFVYSSSLSLCVFLSWIIATTTPSSSLRYILLNYFLRRCLLVFFFSYSVKIFLAQPHAYNTRWMPWTGVLLRHSLSPEQYMCTHHIHTHIYDYKYGGSLYSLFFLRGRWWLAGQVFVGCRSFSYVYIILLYILKAYIYITCFLLLGGGGVVVFPLCTWNT